MNARLRGTWFSGPLSVGVGMAQAALRCSARAAIDSQDASVLSSRRLRPRGSGRAGHAPGLPGPASPQHLRAHTVAGARDRHGGRPRSAGPARGTEGAAQHHVCRACPPPSALRPPRPLAALQPWSPCTARNSGPTHSQHCLRGSPTFVKMVRRCQSKQVKQRRHFFCSNTRKMRRSQKWGSSSVRSSISCICFLQI